MANNENLIPFDKRTESEQREIRSAGGRASGESRRKKANFRRTLNLLLTTRINEPDITPMLEQMGIESTLESAMLAAQIREAMNGNTKAAYFVAQYAGQSSQTEADDREQRIRTDRAKRARDQELGKTEAENDGIQSFLQAMAPGESDMRDLFEESDTHAEEAETTEGV